MHVESAVLDNRRLHQLQNGIKRKWLSKKSMQGMDNVKDHRFLLRLTGAVFYFFLSGKFVKSRKPINSLVNPCSDKYVLKDWMAQV